MGIQVKILLRIRLRLHLGEEGRKKRKILFSQVGFQLHASRERIEGGRKLRALKTQKEKEGWVNVLGWGA